MEPLIVMFDGQYRHVHPKTLPLYSFKHLGPEEEQTFIQWAKDQKEGVIVNPLWHPVVQDELLISGRGVLPQEG